LETQTTSALRSLHTFSPAEIRFKPVRFYPQIFVESPFCRRARCPSAGVAEYKAAGRTAQKRNRKNVSRKAREGMEERAFVLLDSKAAFFCFLCDSA
jgi:hypothetical protein